MMADKEVVIVSVNYFFFPENQNLGFPFKSSKTSYHMLNNKCAKGEY